MPKLNTTGATLALLALSLSASLCARQTAPPAPASSPGGAAAQGQAARPAEDPGSLEAESRQAYADGDYLRFYIANMKLHNRFPYVP